MVGELPDIAQSDLARELAGGSRGRFEELVFFHSPGVLKALDFNVPDLVRLPQVLEIPADRDP